MFEPTDTIDLGLTTPSRQPPALLRHGRHNRLQHLGELFGACDAMRALFETIRRVSAADATVVVLGESGSGKELVARAIHAISPRKAAPFVAVNCGALADTLIDSELFGHERGSFTGAARTHRGCFERANGGTLFLDEITEMRADMQVKLLRALETGRFARVGGDGEIATDVRIVAATNRDLRAAVAAGKLREDLMYRLCVIPVTVPPLRERGEDKLLLADMFLDRMNAEGGTAKAFTDEARSRIGAHSWPGNVRELQNLVRSAYVLSDEHVSVDLKPRDGAAPEPGPVRAAEAHARDDDVVIRVGTSLDAAERTLIMATLRAVDGSKSKAADVLGISLKTLYNRLHAYRDVGQASLGPIADEQARLAA